jgi:hypothetical protein
MDMEPEMGDMEMEEESVEYDLDEEVVEEDDDEVVEEATKLQDKVAEPKGEVIADQSPLSSKPKGTTISSAGTPVKSKDGGEGVKGDSAKNHTPSDNIKVEPKKA